MALRRSLGGLSWLIVALWFGGCAVDEERSAEAVTGDAAYSEVYYGHAPVVLDSEDGRLGHYPASTVFLPNGKAAVTTIRMPRGAVAVTAKGSIGEDGVFRGESKGQWRGGFYFFGCDFTAEFLDGGKRVRTLLEPKRDLRWVKQKPTEPVVFHREDTAEGRRLAREFKKIDRVEAPTDVRVREPLYSVHRFPRKSRIAVAGPVFFAFSSASSRVGLFAFNGWDSDGEPRSDFGSPGIMVDVAELPPGFRKDQVLVIPKENPLTLYNWFGGTVTGKFYDPVASRDLDIIYFPDTP